MIIEDPLPAPFRFFPRRLARFGPNRTEPNRLHPSFVSSAGDRLGARAKSGRRTIHHATTANPIRHRERPRSRYNDDGTNEDESPRRTSRTSRPGDQIRPWVGFSSPSNMNTAVRARAVHDGTVGPEDISTGSVAGAHRWIFMTRCQATRLT